MQINPLLSPTDRLSDQHLLSLVVGEAEAQQLARHALADLFKLHPRVLTLEDAPAPSYGEIVLAAAKELLSRALREVLTKRCVLNTPETVREYLQMRLADRDHEVFTVLLLDSQQQLIADLELFRGTLTQTSVYPREIVKVALANHAASVIFAHNHPSGVTAPSAADIQLTRTLKEALALVDVRTVDHFIVAGLQRPVSMAEQGVM